MKQLKKLEFAKTNVVELSKDDTNKLKGGSDMGCSTRANNTHASTCFTRSCCNSEGCSSN